MNAEQIAHRHGVTDILDVALPDATGRAFVVDAAAFLPLYHDLRRAFPETGLWPVTTGQAHSARDVADSEFWMGSEETTAELLEAASKLDLSAWLARHAYAEGDDPDLDVEDFVSGFGAPSDFAEEAGDAGSAVQDQPFSLRDPLTNTPLPSVGVLLVPVAQPWEVPVALRFGGWNDAPEPAVQSALLRRWYEAYGAVPVAVTRDILELWLDQPAPEPALAAVAQEQAAFCPDIVDQGVQTVAALAGALKESRVWYFWWD